MRTLHFNDRKGVYPHGFYLSENEFWVIYYLHCGSSITNLSNALGINPKMISYYKRSAMQRLKLDDDRMLSQWLMSL